MGMGTRTLNLLLVVQEHVCVHSPQHNTHLLTPLTLLSIPASSPCLGASLPLPKQGLFLPRYYQVHAALPCSLCDILFGLIDGWHVNSSKQVAVHVVSAS